MAPTVCSHILSREVEIEGKIERNGVISNEGKFYQCHDQFLRLWDYVYGSGSMKKNLLFERENFYTICQDQKVFYMFFTHSVLSCLADYIFKAADILNLKYLSWI
jgi:hypothetical protein